MEHVILKTVLPDNWQSPTLGKTLQSEIMIMIA